MTLTPDLRSDIVNGRYRLINLLGEGGMGSVFLAADLAFQGRPIALKRLHPDLLDRESVAAFKGEFEAMTRLRHPNVVEVYDFGIDQGSGRYFLTLEYVEGADLLRAASHLSMQEKVERMVQVCRGLDYIHARGLIHNDLKPQNIMVTSTMPATCKLMDFGLVLAGVESQGALHRLHGTLHYLAPELLQGGRPGRRSDLYSLGVIFYRILTGRFPHDGEPGELLRRVQAGQPDPPTRWDPSLPPVMEEMVLRLLAKDPDARPENAAAVIGGLSAVTGVKYEIQTPATRASYARSGSLVGRQEEIERLVGFIQASHPPRSEGATGRLALLSGEGGIGKSRLMHHLRYEAQLRGGSFAAGQCYEESAAAFHPFVQILRQVLPDGAADPVLAPLLAASGGAAPEAAAGGSSSARADPEREQRRVIDAASQAILSAASQPLLICVEDLQWADTASLNLLEHLARNAAADPLSGGLVLVATYRSEDAEAPLLSATLPRLLRAAAWERIELSRLDSEGVSAMLAGMFGLESTPSGLVDLILRETEGNPLFVQVAVESLLEEQELARPGVDWLASVEWLREIPFPRSMSEAIARRVARLEPAEASVLEALAVAEKSVEKSLLVRILQPEEIETSVASAVEGLLRRRLAVREVDSSGILKLRIDHVKIRHHVYESMDWSRRRELHGRFGLALEAIGSAGVEELANHFMNSPDSERGLSYAHRAGLHALGLCATERAVSLLERALELVPPADTLLRLQLQLTLADAHRQGRDHGRAIQMYDRILKGARASGLKEIAWTAASHMMDVQLRVGQYDEAARAGERLTATLRGEGEKHNLALCLSVMASIAGSQGRMDDARALNEEALALRREIGDIAGMAANLNNLGLIDMLREPSDEGRALLEESLELRRKICDLQHGAEVLINLGAWHQRRGDLGSAAARIEEAADFARRHRDRWILAHCQTNLASLYHAQGRMDRALAAARDAVDSARAIGDAPRECEALDLQGMVERDLGRSAEAVALHEKMAAVARRAGQASQEAYALISLALDRPGQDPKMLRDLLRKASRLDAAGRSTRLQARLNEASARACLAAVEIPQASQHARAALEAAVTGKIADAQAGAELLLAECLLAEEGEEKLEEACGAARRAVEIAEASGLAEAGWQGHALLASIERKAGRRSAEREELVIAAGMLDRISSSIEETPIRLAYLAEPRRAEVTRQARAVAARRSGSPMEATPERTLSAIYEISSIINSMSDLDSLLDRVLDVGLGIVGAERGLIILLDEMTGKQDVAAARELEEETVSDALAYSHSVVKEAAAGRIIVAMDARADERFRNFKSVSLYSIKSLMCVPMKIRDRIIGTVYVDSRRHGVPFGDQDLRFLEAFANLAAGAVEQARLHQRLASENVYLRRVAGERNGYQNIIGKNVKMQAVYDLMEKVSASNLPVLIQGESGTGKELVARALHYSGPRRQKKFLSENVAAIPDALLESEMFGHMRGAFTGADRDHKGLFELADGGTLFLDEIGDMSLPMQSKLLRALQEGEIRPVGAKESRKVDVRIISATNKDIDRLLKEAKFREDLYYRLNVVRVTLPPLRERKEDIPLLVEHFLSKATRGAGGMPRRLELGALQLLLRYSWPGNVRELENELQRLAVLCAGDMITQRDIMESGELYDKITSLDEKDVFTPLEELERRQIEKALMEAAGNRGRAAELLGISRATIFRKLRKFGISH